MLEGFQCIRCKHTWLPREQEQPPQTCPKCKSPYWDTPRKADLLSQGFVKSKFPAEMLRDKSVEFDFVRGGKSMKGFGHFRVDDCSGSLMQIVIELASVKGDGEKIVLTQSEADHIESHTASRKFRFRCFC